MTVTKRIWKKRNIRDIWTAEEFLEAVSYCNNDLLLLAMHIAFACTLRLGEILGLRWEDIYPDGNKEEPEKPYLTVKCELQRVNREVMQKLYSKSIVLTFPPTIKGGTTQLVLKTPKTDSSIRKVYLPVSLVDMFCKRYAQIEEDKNIFGKDYTDYKLVFCNNVGRPIESSIIEKDFRDLIQKNNLKPVVFHSLRHTSITYKLKLTGGDMKAVQGDSGHSGLKMIEDVYSHILDKDRAKTAEIFKEHFYKSNRETLSDREDFVESNDIENANQNNNSELQKELKHILSDDNMLSLLESLLKEQRRNTGYLS